MKRIKQKFNQGFTFIELIVVITILVVVSTLSANTFFSLLKGSGKTSLTNEVRQNGDYALSVMERMLRNAVSLESDCSSTPTTSASITIVNIDGGMTTFSCPESIDGQIASSSASTTYYLTSNKTAVSIYPDGCYFTCTRLTNSAPAIIKLFFTIHQLQPTSAVTRPEDKVSIDFETSVVVRNTNY